jgi:hypothetical protein
MPYTNHLNAVIAMTMGWMDPQPPLPPQVLEFLSLLGYLDLQTHTLNRLTPGKLIWYTYCRGQQGIHFTSGLPYSLLDLLSASHMEHIEPILLAWILPPGTTAQQHLWKATRFAGMISTRRIQQGHGSSCSTTTTHVTSISNEALVNNILVSIQQCLEVVTEQSAQFKQTMIYPLVTAAALGNDLSVTSKNFIRVTIHNLASERNHVLYAGILDVINEFWEGEVATIEDTAQRRNVELCLL